MIKFKFQFLPVAAAFALAFSSCNDSVIFEGEGNCDTDTPVITEYTPHVQFIYKKHRQALHSVAGRESDAFYSTVNTVHLFVFNADTDELVFDRIEDTDMLANAFELGLGTTFDRCYMPLDLPAGNYRLVAWCGLDKEDHNNAFSLSNQLTKAMPFHECGVKLDPVTGHPVNHEKFEGVYHGRLESAVISVDRDKPQIFPIELTKDNNDIAVWVQHTTASFAEGDYTVVYTDANGSMNFEDNSISNKVHLQYHPYKTSVLSSETVYNGQTVEAGALVAHLSTSRLMHSNAADARLEVRDRDGKTVFSIPFIRYVTEMQTFTNDSQYYLDCEDTYNVSFYLTGDQGVDESGEYWIPVRIIINNWVRVPDQSEEI